MNAHAKIKQWLEENKQRGTRLLQQLVQEGSIRGNESSAQAIIIEKCRKLGLTLDIWEIGKEQLIMHPAFCSDRKDFFRKPQCGGCFERNRRRKVHHPQWPY